MCWYGFYTGQLPCYHWDKLEKHLVSYPIFLSYSPRQLYFSHLFFFPPTFIIFYVPLQTLCTFTLLCVCVCVRVSVCVRVVCVQSLEKLAHPTISSSGVHFPSVGMSEMNIFGWNGAERCILTQTRFAHLFLPARPRSRILTGRNGIKFQTIAGL